MKKILSLLVLILIFSSCTDARQAKLLGYGEDYKIEILSSATGQVIKTYHSSGKVSSEETSDGYYFMDQETGELTEIAGGIIVITPEEYVATKVLIKKVDSIQ
jgi:hypothetical protein